MEDIFESIFGVLVVILLIGVAIYLAILFIVYVVIPAAIMAGYGWACYRLGRTLFGRYQHTSKSAWTLFGTGIGSYACSIILVRAFIPNLESGELLLLLALLPAALIFLLVGLSISEIWAYAKRFESTNEVRGLKGQESYLSREIKTIESQIQHYENRLSSLSQREKVGSGKVEELERVIQAWVIRDAANRSLLVREWKKVIKNFDLEILKEKQKSLENQKVANCLEEEQRRIQQGLVTMERIERSIMDHRKEQKAIQDKLFELNEEKKTWMNKLNQTSRNRETLEGQLSLIKGKKAILN